MNKRLVIVGSILVLGFIFIIIFVHDSYLDDQKYNHNPINMTSYEVSGSYQINPETILNKLDQVKTNIFLPFLGDPFTTEELSNVNISWSQSDYLKIADALSQLVWQEPLNFQDWKLYSLHFRRSCRGNGFDYGEITYFKSYNVNWHRGYITRHIEIDPYSGIVRWGDQETYPQPILFKKWHGFDLSTSKVTADDAMRIADENGGKQMRLKEENKCYINLRVPVSSTHNYDNWRVSFVGDNLFELYIDTRTGKVELHE